MSFSKFALAGAAVAVLAATPALAASDADNVIATVLKYASAIDAADFPASFATQTPDVQITDEVPPYHWQGQGAAMQWLKDWDVYANAKGINGQKMTWTGPPRIAIDGDHAYAVFPGSFGFKVKGVQMNEIGTLGATLIRTPDGWLINAWTWAGAEPKQASQP
jgi:SnoaL-like domain